MSIETRPMSEINGGDAAPTSVLKAALTEAPATPLSDALRSQIHSSETVVPHPIPAKPDIPNTVAPQQVHRRVESEGEVNNSSDKSIETAPRSETQTNQSEAEPRVVLSPYMKHLPGYDDAKAERGEYVMDESPDGRVFLLDPQTGYRVAYRETRSVDGSKPLVTWEDNKAIFRDRITGEKIGEIPRTAGGEDEEIAELKTEYVGADEDFLFAIQRVRAAVTAFRPQTSELLYQYWAEAYTRGLESLVPDIETNQPNRRGKNLEKEAALGLIYNSYEKILRPIAENLPSEEHTERAYDQNAAQQYQSLISGLGFHPRLAREIADDFHARFYTHNAGVAAWTRSEEAYAGSMAGGLTVRDFKVIRGVVSEMKDDITYKGVNVGTEAKKEIVYGGVYGVGEIQDWLWETRGAVFRGQAGEDIPLDSLRTGVGLNDFEKTVWHNAVDRKTGIDLTKAEIQARSDIAYLRLRAKVARQFSYRDYKDFVFLKGNELAVELIEEYLYLNGKTSRSETEDTRLNYLKGNVNLRKVGDEVDRKAIIARRLFDITLETGKWDGARFSYDEKVPEEYRGKPIFVAIKPTIVHHHEGRDVVVHLNEVPATREEEKALDDLRKRYPHLITQALSTAKQTLYRDHWNWLDHSSSLSGSGADGPRRFLNSPEYRARNTRAPGHAPHLVPYAYTPLHSWLEQRQYNSINDFIENWNADFTQRLQYGQKFGNAKKLEGFFLTYVNNPEAIQSRDMKIIEEILKLTGGETSLFQAPEEEHVYASFLVEGLILENYLYINKDFPGTMRRISFIEAFNRIEEAEKNHHFINHELQEELKRELYRHTLPEPLQGLSDNKLFQEVYYLFRGARLGEAIAALIAYILGQGFKQ